jgi:hypothetical protein
MLRIECSGPSHIKSLIGRCLDRIREQVEGLHMIAKYRRYVISLLSIALAACGTAATKKAEAPAKVEVIGHESELLKLTLTPAAEERLGIETVNVGIGSLARIFSAHGEILVPAIDGGVPISAQNDLAALAVSQVRADGDIARARAEVALAQKAASRASALVREEAGSVRSQDEAQSALSIAVASLRSAQAQRALLGSSPASLGRQGVLWVRVAAFAGDLAQIDRSASAKVRDLGGGSVQLSARPVSAPPSANVTAGTVDLYYAIPNRGGTFRVGQRVAVDLPTTGVASGLMVSTSAVLRDAYGGEWVYARTAPHVYERRRIEINATNGEQVMIARGLTVGAEVVTAGAAELFGTEFGAK